MAGNTEELLLKIRDLEKEVARWKSQVKEQRYGLNWIDVPEAFDQETENSIPILEEVPEKAIKNDDGKPTHILIEGDNYHALTCLNYTHKGKIDVIYIDPPYNTGSDGFIYKDKRMMDEYPDGTTIPKEHPLRHSSWLSFMGKRLKLARTLLSKTGVIFISIDDNEQANLKLLCDKIFGENNFVASMIWRGGKRNMSKWISTSHEYMLLYAGDLKYCETHNVEWFEEKKGLDEIYKNADKFVKETNHDYAKSSVLLKKWFKTLPDSDPSKDHDHYCWIDECGVYFASDISRGGGGGPTWEIKNPFTGEIVKTPQRGWAYSSIEELNEDIAKNLIHFNGTGVPCKKRYLKENETQILDTVFYKDRRGSSKRLKNLMGGEVFPFPKDELVIKEKLHSFSQKKSVVLDFFAGSGTTMHATMNSNEDDGGLRQCILVQAQEPTYELKNNKKIAKKGSEGAFNNGYEYISEITYERNRRVIQGYTNPKGEHIPGLGNSLKYYRTAFVGKHCCKDALDSDKMELAAKAGCLIALAEQTMETIPVEKNCQDFFQLYSDNNNRYTAIYFNSDYDRFDKLVKQVEDIRKQNRGSKFNVYIFSWDQPDIFENEFHDLHGITIKGIPQPILEIYKAING